jgi:hypothetical protein
MVDARGVELGPAQGGRDIGSGQHGAGIGHLGLPQHVVRNCAVPGLLRRDRVMVDDNPRVNGADPVEDAFGEVDGHQDVDRCGVPCWHTRAHFSPVRATPSTKYFWKNAKTTSIGRIDRNDMARSGPKFVLNWEMRNCRPTGKV